MKNIDIMTTILSEVTGKPQPEIRRMIAKINLTNPSTKLLEDVPNDQAEKLMNDMRKEKAGILNWLIQGARAAHADPSFIEDIERNWRQRN